MSDGDTDWLDKLADADGVIAELREQRDALVGALRALFDEQVWPPTVSREFQWRVAMDRAEAILKKAEGK